MIQNILIANSTFFDLWGKYSSQYKNDSFSLIYDSPFSYLIYIKFIALI